MSERFAITDGRPFPMGATFDGEGANFAVFSANAERIEICLFSHDGKREVQRLPLPEREGDIWYGYVAGLHPGQSYGLRAHGPYRPEHGHRFNPSKLLIDPYARALHGPLVWHDAILGYEAGSGDLSFDTNDSAPYVPKSVITAPDGFDWEGVSAPRHPMAQTVIYEAHVKGLTRLMPGTDHPGTFAALGSNRVIDHLTDLGITAVELLPVHAFIDDKHLYDRGLTNYWGYQSIGWFAPHPAYGCIADFQKMVKRLHAAGIEVILDVVFNHSGEGDALGPTLSLRGLDNASYYRLQDDPRLYVNDTGTGNTLDTTHPMVLRLMMDSLRYWAGVMGVDGFRFDLAPALGRTRSGFDPAAPFFDALRQDPLLASRKLIAEPWDLGPAGYQLGAFPAPFAEWNDKYRDGVRRFWRGDAGQAGEMAARLAGSAQLFDRGGRPATSSVNFLTAHDGFTLDDVVSYSRRHNEANGENGADGHGDNHSDNFGAEGAGDDTAMLAARSARKRAMLATLMLSQGTPMLLAGDEIGNSQGGNNNAYCQDNEVTWLDWERADQAFLVFVRQAIAFRKAHPVLRQRLFLHSRERASDGREDLFWRRTDGATMKGADWHDPELKIICAELRMASDTPAYAAQENALFVVLNAGSETSVTLPACPVGAYWYWGLDSANPDRQPDRITMPRVTVAGQSVIALVMGMD
jgi:isoamylase